MRDWTASALGTIMKSSVPSKRNSHDVNAWLGLMLRRLFRTCDFQGARNGP